jgi:hypothetical protein
MTPSIFLHTRAVCNPEPWQTHSLLGDPPAAVEFTKVEQKLLWLGLDPAASEGEVDVAGGKLLRSFRKRGLTAEAIIAASAQAMWKARVLDSARGYVLTFGRYKGKAVGAVPISYLRWVLANCTKAPHNLRRAIAIVLDAGIKK